MSERLFEKPAKRAHRRAAQQNVLELSTVLLMFSEGQKHKFMDIRCQTRYCYWWRDLVICFSYYYCYYPKGNLVCSQTLSLFSGSQLFTAEGRRGGLRGKEEGRFPLIGYKINIPNLRSSHVSHSSLPSHRWASSIRKGTTRSCECVHKCLYYGCHDRTILTIIGILKTEILISCMIILHRC